MIDRQHPRDLYDLFRFGKADLTHNSELMRKLAVLFCSTMDHDLRSYSMERFVNIDDEAIEAIKHLLYPLLKLDLADIPSCAAAAKELISKEDRLDILFNTA